MLPGNIPEELGDLTALTTLWLQNNSLSGEIITSNISEILLMMFGGSKKVLHGPISHLAHIATMSMIHALNH